MKKFLFYISLFVIFTGCSTNGVVVKKDKEPFFNFIQKQVVIEKKNLSLNTLNIRQHKLENDNKRVLFYEDVSTWDDYEFRRNNLNNITYIFNAKGVSVLYNDNTTLLVQIELLMNQYVNVMAYSNDSENLSYVYGLSNYEFKKIAKELTKDSTKRLLSLPKQGIAVGKEDMSLTRWSETKLIVKPFTVLSNGRTLF